MIKKIFRYIGIEKFGWIELVMALYPILAGYGYGSFKLAFGVLLLLDILIMISGHNKKLKCLPLTIFCSYLIFHDIVFIPLLPSVPSYYINSIITTVIYAISLYIIAPQINFSKFRTAINVIALICMGGMVYHVMMLSLGQSISPIKLPFLPDMAQNTRLYEIVERPTSFFWEPQSYATFMLVPLFLALNERKFVYAFVIAALMIVSTSTTGLLLSILMFILILVSKRSKWYTTLFAVMAVYALGYFLFTSQYSAAGLEKLQGTNLEESNRVINGIIITQNLDASDLILGIPFANEQDAYDAGYFGSQLIVYEDGVLFISAIWIALIRYGVIGFVLFLLPYFWLYKKDHQLYPYLICVIVCHFSNSDFMGSIYVFQVIVMLVFLSRNIKSQVNIIDHASKNSYIPIR